MNYIRMGVVLVLVALLAIAGAAKAETLDDLKANLIRGSRGRLSADAVELAALEMYLREMTARGFAPRIQRLKAEIARVEASRELAMDQITLAAGRSVAALQRARVEAARKKAEADKAAKATEAAKPENKAKAAKAAFEKAKAAYEAAVAAYEKAKKEVFDAKKKAGAKKPKAKPKGVKK